MHPSWEEGSGLKDEQSLDAGVQSHQMTSLCTIFALFFPYLFIMVWLAGWKRSYVESFGSNKIKMEYQLPS